MPVQNPENRPENPEISANDAVDFLKFKKDQAEKLHAERDRDREYFDRQAESELAEKVAGIVEFKPAIQSETGEESSLPPEVLAEINEDPRGWLNRVIGNSKLSPHQQAEGMALAIEQEEQAQLKKAA
jgi:hypothetical protein